MRLIKFKKDQKGSILIFTTIILTVVMIISFAILRIFLPKIKIVNESVNSAIALYAADSGLEWCLYVNRVPSIPPPTPTPVPSPTIGDIEGVTIKYYRDSNLTNCIGGTINFRAVGLYRGVGRSLEIFEP